jgi:antitoxin (DNA-binding transcriptional repressor) of toxin-antitoxin stability system
MGVVDIDAAKTHLSRLVDQAAAGEEIVIARAGKPVARQVKLGDTPKKRVLGLLKGRMTVSDDFNAPLPEDLLALIEGR